jgi:hypothetical protein
MTIDDLIDAKERIAATGIRVRSGKLVGTLTGFRYVGLGQERHKRGVPPCYADVNWDDGRSFPVKPKFLRLALKG